MFPPDASHDRESAGLFFAGGGDVDMRVFTLFLELAQMWVAVRSTMTTSSDRTCISGQFSDLITCHLV